MHFYLAENVLRKTLSFFEFDFISGPLAGRPALCGPMTRTDKVNSKHLVSLPICIQSNASAIFRNFNMKNLVAGII